jgi:YD repeat-containing protein
MRMGTWRGLFIAAFVLLLSLAARVPVRAQGWPNGYSYRRIITIDHTKVPNSDQANFPVLVSATYSDLATTGNGGSVTSTNGYDITFSSDPAGSSTLAFEQESYNASTGAINYWIKIPSLSHTSDTLLYMFYGKSSITTDQSNKNGVWDSNFVLVSHLSDNAANTTVGDSTSNANNLTNHANTSTKTATGEINKGLTYNGSTDYSSIANNSSVNIQGSAVTLEVWAKPTNSTAASYERLIAKEYPGSTDPYVRYGLNRTAPGSSQVTFHISTGGSGSYTQVAGGSMSAGAWMHIVGVYNGSTMTLYINGSSVNSASKTGNIGSSTTPLEVAEDTEISSQYFNGVLDELRISNSARSADWIATEYNNQSSPSTFYSVGSALSSGPLISSLSTTSGDIGSSVTITGSGFGSTQGSSTVTFSGTSATVTSWSSTSVVVTVPVGAITGNVFVTVSSVISNGIGFTVTGGPWSNGYTYRRAVTIDHTKVPNSDETNFPVLFSGTYSYLATTANGGGVTNTNGYDVMFTLDASGTSGLAFEQESYSASTGAVNYWVKIPTVSHTSNTVFYLFYGNSSVTTDQSNKTGVWDSNFVLVSHLDDNAASTAVADSTSNANSLTNHVNTSTKTAIGEINNGLTYNGSSDYSSLANNSSVNIQGSAITLEAWAKPTNSTAATYEHLIAKEIAGNADPYMRYGFYRTAPGSSQVTFHISTGGSGSYTQVAGGSTVAGTWMHIVGVYNGSTATLYINGSSVNSASKTGNIGSSTTPLVLGADTEISSEYFNGVLDEVRISNSVRSADWIATEYNNQSSPWTFCDEGSPIITSLSPTSGYFATSVTITGKHFGSTQGSSTVTFNGTSATITSWSDTSIVAPVPVGVTSGNVVVTVSGLASHGINFSIFPTGWSDQDVGSVGVAGSASYGNDTFTVKGDGSQLWNTTDAFNLTYQSLSGDGTIIARLASLQGSSNLRSAGVMIRETLTAGSKYTAVDYTNNGFGAWYAYSIYRTTTSGSTSQQSGPNTGLPIWMKLVRSGSTFTAYTSSNGVDWAQIGTSITNSMATSVYVGLFVDSGDTSSLGTATFDNVSVSQSSSSAPVISSVSATTGAVGAQVVISGSGFGSTEGSGIVYLNDAPVTINSWGSSSITITIPSAATSGFLVVSVAPSMDSNPVFFTVTSQPLPFTWLDDDVGSVGLAGSATYDGGTFTITGAGVGIWNSADGFHFVYQPLSGSGTIIARLVSFSVSSSNGSAGVMIRETLGAGSTHADMDRMNFLGNGNYYCVFAYRASTGSSLSTTQGPLAQTLPYWLKVSRSGNTFTAYSSTDGVSWTQTGASQTISMATNVYIGLAVTSGLTSTLATATFDNVRTYKAGQLSGTITKASDGSALSGASVQAMQRGAVIGTTTSDASGKYGMYLVGGSYDIKVSASGYGTSVSNAIFVPGASAATLNVSLSSPGSVSGTVTQSNGTTPIQGTIVQTLVGDASVASTSTASDGTYTISGLTAGTYQVQASANGYVSAGQSATVTASGTATENFSLQAQSSGAVSYLYDPIGRLVAVINPSGNTAIYNYDAVGNLLSISSQSSSLLSIISFTPASGSVGGAVTISGTGFNSTPSQNTVKFNGVAGTVTSASPTQLTVIVPIGATTGTISVTTSAGTVTSSSSFTVTNP